MSEYLLGHEPQVRLISLFSILATMAVWELAAPRRRQEIPRLLRWSNNIGMTVIDTLLVRLTFPLLAVGMASYAVVRGWGLFNVFQVPSWIAFLVSFLLFDLAIYLQHVMFHAVPLTYPSVDTLNATNYLIRLDGADYITFHQISLQRSGILAYGRVLDLTNNASHNTISHCRLLGSTNATNNSLAASS